MAQIIAEHQNYLLVSNTDINCIYMAVNILKYDDKQLYFGLTLIKYGMEFKFIILRFEAN